MITQSRLANLAAAAYVAPPTWEAPGDIHATHFDEAGAVVIACRGTVSLHNWGVDLDADLRWKWPYGFVHDGFWKAGTILWQKMRGLVLSSQNPVYFTGHSLGAGLSIVLAAMYINDGGKNPIVCALAPPRVGGFMLRRALIGAKLSLYRRADDLVPLVPHFFGIYSQPAPLIHLDPNLILGPLAAHSCTGYVKAIENLEVKELAA